MFKIPYVQALLLLLLIIIQNITIDAWRCGPCFVWNSYYGEEELKCCCITENRQNRYRGESWDTRRSCLEYCPNHETEKEESSSS